MKIKLDTFNHDQVRFITESLESLTKKAFGINIFFKSYLISKKVYKGKNLEFRRYYKLLDTIKKELPDKLFKNIIFIDSEQSEKILKKIPVFELYQNYLEGQYVTFDGKYYLINKIDYDAGIVNLIYSSNTNNIRYRQIREISNIKHLTIIKELPVLRIRDSVLKKYILCAELEVNTNGYYEFNNAISFVPGEFGYKQVDANKKGLHRKYKYTNVFFFIIC